MKALFYIALFQTILAANLPAADLLVAMSGGGTVERYDSATQGDCAMMGILA